MKGQLRKDAKTLNMSEREEDRELNLSSTLLLIGIALRGC